MPADQLLTAYLTTEEIQRAAASLTRMVYSDPIQPWLKADTYRGCLQDPKLKISNSML
jgi:hypothetical protein